MKQSNRRKGVPPKRRSGDGRADSTLDAMMWLPTATPEFVEYFQKYFKARTGRDLTDAEAFESGTRLLRIYYLQLCLGIEPREKDDGTSRNMNCELPMELRDDCSLSQSDRT